MRSVSVLICILMTPWVIALWSAASIDERGSTLEGFTKVDPNGAQGVEATAANMLVESPSGKKPHLLAGRDPSSRPLLVKLVNNFGHGNVKAYISGLDPNGNVFFVGSDGTSIYPDAKSSRSPVEISQEIAIPLRSGNEPLSIKIPSYIRSGRVYFSIGDLKFFVVDMGKGSSIIQPSVTNQRDPNANTNWGFIELTYIDELLYANISYVDFVGIVLGMMLVTKDGNSQTTAGLETDAVTKICKDLSKQSKLDGHRWTSLCVINADRNPIRVLSPGNYHDINPEMYDKYWDSYVADVWRKYAAQDLIIDTQSEAGVVKCRVVGGKLVCNGSEQRFDKPTAKDIWGCNSGPFAASQHSTPIHIAVIPRLCAAFVRSTLLVEGGNIQPSLGQESYYTTDTTNHYSRIVHSYEIDGRGYTFAYDDVNPDGTEDSSGVLSSNNVQALVIHVGGPITQVSPR
ncbi:uncharacterized protein FIESC28_05789 [Fusarium coffeatum]|uniref:GH64 domain-containing protein n=1 Tax=Fusarium coffeatum TaxID=231269 RepID=A0A366RPD5_9HYPO|nr:uncharacterized protein FIESC28_05789 [Fusarium coffeatum]RBR18967.1 hypothetical protein FIESC28_05789 [Fusarium coffeatum]